MDSNWSYSPETPNLGQIRRFLEPCDLEIWRMTLNKANLRDLIAATGLEISNWIHIVNFSAHVTVKFDGWPRKTIGDFFYTMASFVHHFKSIGEFKLDLQSGNAEFGSKLKIFFSRVTFKLEGWPWKTIGYLFYDTLSFVYHFNAIGKFKLKSGNAQFGSKSTIYWAVWPRDFTDDPKKRIGHLLYATSSFVYHFVPIGEFKLEL